MIPKTILQTSKDSYPNYVQNMWKDRIDDSWTINWFDDNMIHEFFKNNPLPEFPNISAVFDSFTDGGHKADLFRYYYLYLNGGFFIDSDCMTHVHMNEIYSEKHDHIMVFSDIELNKKCHPEINTPIIFNGLIGCLPRSQIIYEALKNAYTVKLRLLEKQRLYFVHALYVITQKFKNSYNILFFKECTDENYKTYSYILDQKDRKIASHFYAGNKNIPRIVDTSSSINVTKTITFFTTFHKPGYELYGKHWLTTFIRNVSKFNPNMFARIYLEQVDIPGKYNNMEFLDFDQTLPNHSAWEETVRTTPELFAIPDADITRETVRFSHKAFVMQHALKTIKTDYAIWVDADCVFYKESYDHFPENIIEDNFFAGQLEEQPNNECGNHIESGILIFDMHHPNTIKFVERFSDNYKLENLKKCIRPFDGYIINKTLEELNLPYTNLNEKYGVPGINGLSSNTFLHPEIKKRFKHNIGADGKAEYTDWNNVKTLDENFRHLQTHLETHKGK